MWENKNGQQNGRELIIQISKSDQFHVYHSFPLATELNPKSYNTREILVSENLFPDK